MSRSFGAHRALDDVDLRLAVGEIVGLVGENGAGKSTLLNVLSGVLPPDAGEIALDGRPVRLRDHHAANRHGIFRLHQEPALLPNAAVYENMFLAHEAHFSSAGLLRRSAMVEACADVLRRFDHPHIDPRAPTGRLDLSTRQALDLVRVFALTELLDVASPVVLLDEPTSVLSSTDIAFLLDRLRRIKEHAAVVFVSHRLTETLEISDRVVVLRDGRCTAELATDGVTEADLHALMVGRNRNAAFYREDRQRRADPGVALSVRQLDHQDFRGVSLDVHAGEVVGVGGVLNAGKSSLGRAVVGASPVASGTVAVHGRELPTRWSVREMVRRGVGYLPPDRNDDGVIGVASVSDNISSVCVALGVDGPVLLRPRREQRRAERYIGRLRIRVRDPGTPVRALSGGNQQKTALARWLAADATVFVLDNPTRGMDAGAKEEMYTIVRDLADAGAAFLVISDDLLELIGLSNRVLVMRDGAVVAEVPAPPDAKPQESDLVRHMV